MPPSAPDGVPAEAALEGAALALRQLTRRHPGAARAAVDHLTLAAAPGELLVLLGASGSGKTTTLRLVAGYERPDGGAVLLGGHDVTRTPPERRGVGMVFQHYALFPHLSVEENVAFGLEARGVARAERGAQARSALADVGLAGLEGRPVQALSGGEQQRVALARALVIRPRVLLLDEPLSNLDPGLRVGVREELRALLRRTAVTALLVTHDQEDAFAVADRVALLERGRLLQVGAPEAIYDRPASRAVAGFIGRGALVRATLDEDAADGPGAALRATVRLAGVAQHAAALLPPTVDARAARRWPAALALLRPEQLALLDADAPHGWPGQVTTRRFVAGRVVVQVALADGCRVEAATSERRVREGDRVRVRLVAGAVAVVADDGEGDGAPERGADGPARPAPVGPPAG